MGSGWAVTSFISVSFLAGLAMFCGKKRREKRRIWWSCKCFAVTALYCHPPLLSPLPGGCGATSTSSSLGGPLGWGYLVGEDAGEVKAMRAKGLYDFRDGQQKL